MHYRLQNLLWLLRETFRSERRGNLVAEILKLAGSGLAATDFQEVNCSYRVCKRMLDPTHLRTLFIVRSDVFEKLEALMVEVYRDYEQSRHGQSLLFYSKGRMDLVSVIGRGRGYVFAHIVRDRKAGS
jgi:hypothetical protein